MEVELLRRDLDEMRKDLLELKGSIDSLVTAWKMAGHMVALVKWTAGIVSAIAAAWLALTKMKTGA